MKIKSSYANTSLTMLICYCCVISLMLVLITFCSSKKTSSQQQAQKIGTIADYESNQSALAEGKSLFEANCSKNCHGLDLKGKGPTFMNLTATKLKFGDSDKDLTESIMNGRPENNMPAFSIIGEEKVNKIIAYIKSIRKKPVN